MRFISFIFLIALAAGCASSQKSNVMSGKLNGTWIPVKQEIGGTSLPEAVYKTQKLIIKDTLYTVMAESVDKGTVQVSGNKMDIYGKEGVNAGKHFTAIYKLENDQLTVCYNLSGDNYPDSFETKSKPMFFLSVFEKDLSKG